MWQYHFSKSRRVTRNTNASGTCGLFSKNFILVGSDFMFYLLVQIYVPCLSTHMFSCCGHHRKLSWLFPRIMERSWSSIRICWGESWVLRLSRVQIDQHFPWCRQWSSPYNHTLTCCSWKVKRKSHALVPVTIHSYYGDISCLSLWWLYLCPDSENAAASGSGNHHGTLLLQHTSSYTWLCGSSGSL